MKKAGLSRRKLLALGSAAGALGIAGMDPVRQFLGSLVQGMISKARRQEMSAAGGPPARNYLQINLYGSPSRWLFDNPLRPFDGETLIPCPGVINRFTQLDAQAPHRSRAEYADVKVAGVNMPYLWNFNVPRAGGGERPLAPLLDNMLIIRGCDMGLDGHPGNSARLVSPVVGGTSFTSLIADRARTPIPALSVGRTPANRAYRSERGVGVVDIPPEDPDYAAFLLEAFLGDQEQSFRAQKDVDRSITAALDELRAYTLSNNAGAEILFNERDRAEKLIRQGLSNLGGTYAGLVAKYSDLISRGTGTGPIPGVTDQVIPGAAFPCSVPGQARALDALASHHFSDHIICDADLRRVFEAPAMRHMAQHFAIAEFTLAQGLSSSILVAPPKEMGSIYHDVTFARAARLQDIETRFDAASNQTYFTLKKNPVKLQTQIDYDSHTIGSYVNLVSCSLFYRAFGACLLELTDRLKALTLEGQPLFDNTVVHVATEFERVPRDNGATSDHNFKAHMTSVYSGIIKQPTVIGNIYSGTPAPGPYQGTTGVAAPIEGFPGGIVNQNVISSTLSELAGVRPLVPRAHSLVKVENGRVVAQVAAAKNIEGSPGNEKA